MEPEACPRKDLFERIDAHLVDDPGVEEEDRPGVRRRVRLALCYGACFELCDEVQAFLSEPLP